MSAIVSFIAKFFSREFLAAVGSIYEIIVQTEKLPTDSPGWKILGYAVAAMVAAIFMIVRTYQKAKGV